MTASARAVTLVATLLLACAQGGGGDLDAGPVDGGPTDGARRDGGRDAGRDGGRVDAGPRDAGVDAGGVDAGDLDAGGVDAGGGECPLGPGVLAIVEVMVSSRSGSGDLGEWFEVLNTASCTVAIGGMEVVSPTGGGAEVVHTVTSGTIAPGQRFVFAQSGVPAENHFLDHDYVYGSGTSGVVLRNDADWIELRSGGAVLDRVGWPSTGFTHGKARQLPAGTDPSLNDDWSRWCDATAVYSDAGGTFYGTPKAANGACP